MPPATSSCSRWATGVKECLRAADTAARLGGDEFAILLEDGGEGIQAVDVADRMMQALEAPFVLEGKEVFIRASIGIAVASQGAEVPDAEELLRNADVAMYMAKEKGKGRYQVFEPAMHDTALKRLELKADLQRALEHDGVPPVLPAGDRTRERAGSRASRP